MKFLLALVVILAFVASTALAVPNATEARLATGVNWNYKARVDLLTIKNATLATEQSKVMYKNGTIGHLEGSVFVNGTWVLPMPNSTQEAQANATAAQQAEEAKALNLGEIGGCDMNVPAGFAIDKYVGEWCSLDEKTGGFMFRGVRDAAGKLWLQRFSLSNHKSLNVTVNITVPATYGANATVVQSLLAIDNSVEDMGELELETERDNVMPVSLVDAENEFEAEAETDEEVEEQTEAETEVDAEEEADEAPVMMETEAEAEAEADVDVDAEAETETEAEAEAEAENEGGYEYLDMIELDEEEEAMFIELETRYRDTPMTPAAVGAPIILPAVPFKDPMVVSTPPPPPPPKEEVGKDGLLTVLKNGYVLPELPAKGLHKCNKRVTEFLTCSMTNMMPLNGTEVEGYCMDHQYSSDMGIFLSKFTNVLDSHKSMLSQVVASAGNMAETHHDEKSLNKEDDAVQFCFQPGSVIERERYNVKGGFRSYKLGRSSGVFRPTLKVKCDSVFCKYSYLKKTTYLNFQP